MNLVQRYKAWRKRRYWQSLHLEFLRSMIEGDWRWMAHHPISDALTTRYRRAASESWYQLDHEDVSNFRRRVGLEPENFRAGLKPEDLKRIWLACKSIDNEHFCVEFGNAVIQEAQLRGLTIAARAP